MIGSDRSSRKGILLRQATIRVVTITLAMVATIALMVVWFQHISMDKAAHKNMASLEQFYTGKLILQEQEWQEAIITLHNRIELLNLFKSSDIDWEKVKKSLLQEATALYPVILITDANHRILLTQTTSTAPPLSEHFIANKKSGWFENPSSGMLYRWITQPLWLGTGGSGQLIVFIPIENSLLFRHALPFTDLFVLYHDRVVASSLGNTASLHPKEIEAETFWKENNRLDQRLVPWNPETQDFPRLLIRHHSEPIFTLSEITLLGIMMFVMLSALFWKTLGLWLVELTRRITTLGWVAQEFSTDHRLTPAIQEALASAREGGNDEVTVVANAMTHAQESIAKELQERKIAQATLQRISSHNQLLLDAAGEGIYGLNKEGQTTFINPAAARMIHWEPNELIGRSLHGIVHHTRPDNTPYPHEECRIDAAIREGKIQRVSNEIFWRKDNTCFPVEYTSTPIVDEGEILGAVVVFHDISARILAEKQAQHYLIFQRVINGLYEISYSHVPLQEQLEKALDFILAVPWLAIHAQGAIFLNHPETATLQRIVHKGLEPELLALCQQLPHGYCLCGRAALSKTIIHAHCIDERHDILFNGMKPHGHYSVPILSGETVLGVLTLYLQPDKTSTQEEESLLLAICNTLGSMIERKKLEESLQHYALFLEEKVQERTSELQKHIATLKNTQNQLIQSERMAALGGLVAGISHEIKTPVGTSFTAVTYLETEIVKLQAIYQQGGLKREELEHYLSNIQEATQLIKANLNRASELILSFKQVAVDQTSQEKREFDLGEYLKETVFTLRPQLKLTRHQVIIECPDKILLNGFPGALSQIISNFIINSLHYAFVDHEPGTITIQAGLKEDHSVFLHYRDNGRGMDEETLKRIYEPFFTTNRNQGGSGLGMHIVYNLVTQRLNGTIECFSTPGQGTHFQILFPP
ncbi:MAG: PAS domain-containing protein [Magnetococcales bacterium]|nr:PAS domain-containing protein [Magnetococcales bacterium]